MAHSVVIAGLKDHYARKLGELKALHDAVYRVRGDLAALRHAIKLIDAEYDVTRIAPLRPRKASPWFKSGQCARSTLDVIRTASAPMTAREIAVEVMDRHGIASDDWRAVNAVSGAVRIVLKRSRGKVVVSDGGEPARWSVAPD